MAHNATVNALADELVHVMTLQSREDSPRAFQASKDTALKHFRSLRHGRTNQFAVKSSLSGLVEKFQVFNKEHLADALDQKLTQLNSVPQTLPADSRWIPEILDLLLRLSDRPADKSKLGSIKGAEESPRLPSLTWEDILAEDPSNQNDDLWRNIDHRGGSSDEDQNTVIGLEDETDTESTAPSSKGGEDAQLFLDSLVVDPDIGALKSIKEAYGFTHQNFRSLRKKVPELDAIREALNLLRGLSSQMFRSDTQSREVVPVPQLLTEGCSRTSLAHIMQYFANVAQCLSKLRAYCVEMEKNVLIQRFVSGVAQSIKRFDCAIDEIEKRLVNCTSPFIASLIGLQEEIEQLSEFPLHLHSLISTLWESVQNEPHKVLDGLYERAASAQAMSNQPLFSQFAELLIDCLATYLSPIQRWMHTGEINSDEHIDMPIEVQEGHMHLNTFWKERFLVRLVESTSRPCAPAFLHHVLPEILAAGKSVAFLRELGLGDSMHRQSGDQETPLKSACLLNSNLEFMEFVPFSLKLGEEIKEWVLQKVHPTSELLRSHIIDNFGFLRTVESLEVLYLSKDGNLFDQFADELLSRATQEDLNRQDGFMLEESARNIFSQASCVDPSRVFLSVGKDGRAAGARDADLNLSYHLPWPIANVLHPETLQNTFQPLLGLLLKLHKARKQLPYPARNLIALGSGSSGRQGERQEVTILILYIRHRLSHTIHVLLNYLTQAVFHSSSVNLRQTIFSNLSDGSEALNSVDALIRATASYVQDLREGGFLQHHTRHSSGNSSCSSVGHSHQGAYNPETVQSCINGLCNLINTFAEATGDWWSGTNEASAVGSGNSVEALKSLRWVQRHFIELVGFLAGQLRAASRSEHRYSRTYANNARDNLDYTSAISKKKWDWNELADNLEIGRKAPGDIESRSTRD